MFHIVLRLVFYFNSVVLKEQIFKLIGCIQCCFLAVKAQGETIISTRIRTTTIRNRTADTRTLRTIRISTGEELLNTLSLLLLLTHALHFFLRVEHPVRVIAPAILITPLAIVNSLLDNQQLVECLRLSLRFSISTHTASKQVFFHAQLLTSLCKGFDFVKVKNFVIHCCSFLYHVFSNNSS